MSKEIETKESVQELISEESYREKLARCSKNGLKASITSFYIGIIGIPMLLKGFKLFRIPTEARVAVGLLSGLPILYYTGKSARETCMNEVKENFRYQ